MKKQEIKTKAYSAQSIKGKKNNYDQGVDKVLNFHLFRIICMHDRNIFAPSNIGRIFFQGA